MFGCKTFEILYNLILQPFIESVFLLFLLFFHLIEEFKLFNILALIDWKQSHNQLNLSIPDRWWERKNTGKRFKNQLYCLIDWLKILFHYFKQKKPCSFFFVVVIIAIPWLLANVSLTKNFFVHMFSFFYMPIRQLPKLSIRQSLPSSQ